MKKHVLIFNNAYFTQFFEESTGAFRQKRFQKHRRSSYNNDRLMIADNTLFFFFFLGEYDVREIRGTKAVGYV